MFECPICKQICDDEEGVEVWVDYEYFEKPILEIWCSECAAREDN